jgi:RNA polymerase sigma factor (sigma-70 family)
MARSAGWPGNRRRRSPIVQARDHPETFEMVFLTYWDQLLRFMVRRTFDPEAAYDLTAETFTAMLANIERFRGVTERQGQAWMYAIARSELRKWYEDGEASRHHRDHFELDLPSPEADELERIEELADIEPVRRVVIEAMGNLPPGHRRVLELRVVQELTYNELAAELATTTNAARVRVARAVAALYDAVEQLGEDDARYQAVTSQEQLT